MKAKKENYIKKLERSRCDGTRLLVCNMVGSEELYLFLLLSLFYSHLSLLLFFINTAFIYYYSNGKRINSNIKGELRIKLTMNKLLNHCHIH